MLIVLKRQLEDTLFKVQTVYLSKELLIWSNLREVIQTWVWDEFSKAGCLCLGCVKFKICSVLNLRLFVIQKWIEV